MDIAYRIVETRKKNDCFKKFDEIRNLRFTFRIYWR
jgi:hypothetical protein